MWIREDDGNCDMDLNVSNCPSLLEFGRSELDIFVRFVSYPSAHSHKIKPLPTSYLNVFPKLPRRINVVLRRVGAVGPSTADLFGGLA